MEIMLLSVMSCLNRWFSLAPWLQTYTYTNAVFVKAVCYMTHAVSIHCVNNTQPFVCAHCIRTNSDVLLMKSVFICSCLHTIC